MKWTKTSGQHFRISDKKPNPRPDYPYEWHPYAQFFKDGSYRDKFGNAVSQHSNAAHVNLDELTDDFLTWFFN